MDKKEILALIGAVSAVLLLIFIMSKVRGTEDVSPAGNVTVEPGEIIQTGAPETDIWDVLHAMNSTAPEQPESETVFVTAIADDGTVYTVTDDAGNAVTQIAPAAEPSADAPVDTAAEPAGAEQGDVPVINVSPAQQTPADVDPGEAYFVVVPAEE